MSLSDCPKCWDTPCTCGYAYRNWDSGRRLELATIILPKGWRIERMPEHLVKHIEKDKKEL